MRNSKSSAFSSRSSHGCAMPGGERASSEKKASLATLAAGLCGIGDDSEPRSPRGTRLPIRRLVVSPPGRRPFRSSALPPTGAAVRPSRPWRCRRPDAPGALRACRRDSSIVYVATPRDRKHEIDPCAGIIDSDFRSSLWNQGAPRLICALHAEIAAATTQLNIGRPSELPQEFTE